MQVLGGIVAAAAVAVIVLLVALGRTPRGERSLSGERDLVWLGVAAITVTGVVFALDLPIVGLIVAIAAAAAVAVLRQNRLDRVVATAAVGGGLLGGLCLLSSWPAAVAIGVGLALLVGVLSIAPTRFRPKVQLAVPSRLLPVPDRWHAAAVGALLALVLGLLAAVPAVAAGLLLAALAAGAALASAAAMALDGRGRWTVTALAAAILTGPVLIALGEERSVTELALAAVMLLATYVAAVELFTEVTGPFDAISKDLRHPFSGTPVEWAWVGAVTPTTATVTARLRSDLDSVEVAPSGTAAVELGDHRMVRMALTDLTPGAPCRLTLRDRGGGDPAEVTFSTFGRDASAVTIAAGSCASTGSEAAVFDRIVESVQPDVFLHLGDLHYENIRSTDPATFHEAYDRVLSSAPQARLFRSTPIAHVWDDHDFGPNNSHSGSPSIGAAQTAYRQAEPHYPLRAAPTERGPGAIYQSFSVGPVRVVLTDTRSERSPPALRNRERRQIMDEDQQEWLLTEVRTAGQDGACRLVVWGCSTPWIGRGGDGDIWEGFDDQRRTIFAALREIGMPLVFVAGDAHMVGIDDGTNSGPDDGVPGFPILAAASLDRRPSSKGSGAYTLGPRPGFGQFGTIRVTTDPELAVELSVHDRHGTVEARPVDPAAWLRPGDGS